MLGFRASWKRSEPPHLGKVIPTFKAWRSKSGSGPETLCGVVPAAAARSCFKCLLWRVLVFCFNCDKKYSFFYKWLVCKCTRNFRFIIIYIFSYNIKLDEFVEENPNFKFVEREGSMQRCICTSCIVSSTLRTRNNAWYNYNYVLYVVIVVYLFLIVYSRNVVLILARMQEVVTRCVLAARCCTVDARILQRWVTRRQWSSLRWRTSRTFWSAY